MKNFYLKRILVRVMLSAALTAIAASGYSQQNQITGNLLSASTAEPVQGAVVRDLKSNTAVVTDSKGNFRIGVAEGTTLEISCLGYVTMNVAVDKRTNYNLAIEEDTKMIEDVVVVGYGTQRRKDLTGAVAVAKVSDMQTAPVASFEQSLAGRIAGVSITSADGQPGQEMNIVIRGGNSITQSNSPLYVVDGFPIEGFSPSSMNAADIKSLTVLKDASATAIYGSRGANGVIIIETNDGKTGRTSITYDGYVGVQSPANKMELMSPYEFVKYQLEVNPVDTKAAYLADGRTLDYYKNVKAIDWQDELMRNAVIHSHSLSINGGNQKTKFSVSGNYTSHDGIIRYSGYERYRARVYVNHTFNRWLRFNVSGEYSNDKSYGDIASQSASTTQTYSGYLMYRTWGYRPVFPNGDYNIMDQPLDEGAMDQRFNPVLDVRNSKRVKKGQYIRGNANVLIKLYKDLELIVKGGIYDRTWKESAFYNSTTSRGSSASASNTKGVNGSVNFRQARSLLNENTLNYKKKIGRHAFTAMVGYTLQANQNETYELTGEQIPIENLGVSGIDTGIPGANKTVITENRLMSWLGRLTYNYDDRYLVTASFRADGSSKFAKKNRWGYFPSAAVAWRISEEKFLENWHFLDNAKLRVSYGLTGNDRISDFGRFEQMGTSYVYYYSYNNGTPQFGIRTTSIGNPDLKWETTAQFDAGIDLSFFNSRLNITVDYYNKHTRDLLLNADLPYTTGFSKVYKNIGAIRNRGWEFTLSTVNVDVRNFRWRSDFNISFNKNKILSLNDGESRLLSSITSGWDMSKTNLYMAQVGHSIGQFIGLIWDGVYTYDDFDKVGDNYVLRADVPANGSSRSTIRPGDIKYRDINGDGTITDKDVVVIGRATPIHIGGFNNEFTIGPVSVSFLFQWSYGNDVMNANRIYLEGNVSNRPMLNQFKSYANRWSEENPDSKLFRAGGAGPTGYYSSRTLEDGSFLRLANANITYSFPKKICKSIGMQNLSLYISGQNLFVWTKYSGMDPEVSVRNTALTPGFDYSAYPRARTFVFGVKATF
ncbi:MAG: TonB-dependent receptor [Alistipes sp.]|nr:TonB-dependent receptor [Alistipes sp.]